MPRRINPPPRNQPNPTQNQNAPEREEAGPEEQEPQELPHQGIAAKRGVGVSQEDPDEGDAGHHEHELTCEGQDELEDGGVEFCMGGVGGGMWGWGVNGLIGLGLC